MECSNYNLSLECTRIFNVETISECNINIETVERTDYINLNVLPLYIDQLPKEKLLLLTTAILANYLIMHKKHFKNCSDRSSEIFRKYAVKEFINIKPTLKRLFDWCSSSETKFCHENVSEFHSKSVFNFPSIFNCFGIFKYNSQKFVGNHSVTCSGSQQRKLKYSHSREKIWYNHLCSKMSGKNQSNQCQKTNIHLEKENENLLYVVERSELMKYDFKISVEIDGDMHEIYILKRPYVDLFLTKMRSLFECVLFTASLAKYANPVADLLDKSDVFRYRLFRESCIFMKGGFVKDLSMLGRTLDQIVIIDNSPVSFMLHPQNAIQITSWFDDLKDRALLDLIPYLQKLAQSTSVTNYLKTDTPPITAAFPTSMAPRLSNKTFYSNMYAPNIPNQIVRNNPITNISQIEQLTFKKTSSSSTGSLKKSVMHGFPSLRNLFSKTFTGNSTEKTNYAGPDIVSKYVVTANIRNNKDFPLNIDRELSIRNAQKEKNFENPSSSSLTFSPVIKQNLNSASEIFSPRYYQVKYSKLIASEETGKYSSLNKNRFRHFLKINNKKRKNIE